MTSGKHGGYHEITYSVLHCYSLQKAWFLGVYALQPNPSWKGCFATTHGPWGDGDGKNEGRDWSTREFLGVFQDERQIQCKKIIPSAMNQLIILSFDVTQIVPNIFIPEDTWDIDPNDPWCHNGVSRRIYSSMEKKGGCGMPQICPPWGLPSIEDLGSWKMWKSLCPQNGRSNKKKVCEKMWAEKNDRCFCFCVEFSKWRYDYLKNQSKMFNLLCCSFAGCGRMFFCEL